MRSISIKKAAVLCAAMMAFSQLPSHAKTLELKIGETALYESANTIEKRNVEITESEAAPFIENDRTMVPLRVISEKFGAAVDWDPGDQKITILCDGKKIVLYIGSLAATVDGEEYALDAAPAIVNDRTVVPLRFISEALGKNVSYISSLGSILVSDEKPVFTVNGYGFTIDDFKFMKACISGNDVSAEYMPEIIAAIKKQFTSIAVLNDLAKRDGFAPDMEKEKKSIAEGLAAVGKAATPYLHLSVGARILEAEALSDLYYDELYGRVNAADAEKYYGDSFVRAKHILLMTDEGMTDTEKAEVKKKAEKILKEAKSGADFDELVAKYCEDPGAKNQPEGYVFTRGEMVEEFENTAFALKVGEMSDLVETYYGYHIIKREELPEADEHILATIKWKIVLDELAQLVKSAQTESLMGDSELALLLS